MAALAASVLIGLQLSADYWAFLYLVWVVPLVCGALYADQADAHPVDSRVRVSRVLDPAAASAR
jgi:hypothetical protein